MNMASASLPSGLIIWVTTELTLKALPQQTKTRQRRRERGVRGGEENPTGARGGRVLGEEGYGGRALVTGCGVIKVPWGKEDLVERVRHVEAQRRYIVAWTHTERPVRFRI